MPEKQDSIALLKSKDSEDIREGAYLAGKARDENAIPLLAEHLQSADIGVQEATERAMRKIGGPKVVGAVIPLLRSEEAPVRNIAMDLLRAVGATNIEPLFALLHDTDPDIRIFASDILGSSASPLAVPPLCNALLRDPEVNVRYQAAVSLGTLAFPEAAVSLNKALEDDEWVRFSVVEALMKIRAESSVTALLKALDSSSELVASVIIDALREMGNVKAVPLLMRRLTTSSGPLRNKIVTAIIRILGSRSLMLLGQKERDELYEYMLVAIADEDDTEVLDAMVDGLAALKGDRAVSAIFDLAHRLNPETDQERLLHYVVALSGIGFNPIIEAKMREGDDYAQMIGVEIISRSPSRTAVEFLKDLFWSMSRDLQRSVILELATQCRSDDQNFFLDVLEKHSDGDVLKATLIFLGRRANMPEASHKVAQFLDHAYEDVRRAALDACIALHDPIITGHFLGLAHNEDPAHRAMAIYALGAIDLTAYEHVIMQSLQDPEADVRRTAVEALGRSCPIPKERVSAIEGLAADTNSEVRLAVITVLGACDDTRLNNWLLRGLEDSDPWVKARCIESLGRSNATGVVPRLVELLADENPLVVIKTIEALGTIGGPVAFRALFSLIDSENYEIQSAAEEAVERIRAGEEGA